MVGSVGLRGSTACPTVQQVDAELRADEGELGDEVPGCRAVDGVGRGGREAELGGHGVRVETQRLACQGTGAVRRVEAFDLESVAHRFLEALP